MKRVIVVLSTITCLLFLLPSLANAQAASNANHIIPDSFTGLYYLSRDKNGVSLLTSEETIVAEFPGGTNFSGITRDLPKNYQGHSVDVKVLSVTDLAGNAVPYKTASEGDNLRITTGDPAVTIYGSQTFRIKYQTIGVIDLRGQDNQFLLNVNGRGWDQPFNRVNATLYIPTSFQASLKQDPSCYVVLGDKTTDNCTISSENKDNQIVTTSKAGPLAAHQALVLKLNFAQSTFANRKASHVWVWFGLAAVAILLTGFIVFVFRRHRRRQN